MTFLKTPLSKVLLAFTILLVSAIIYSVYLSPTALSKGVETDPPESPPKQVVSDTDTEDSQDERPQENTSEPVDEEENNQEQEKPVPVEKPRENNPPPTNRPPPAVSVDIGLNAYVLSVINTYSIGQYPYLLNNDYQNYSGVTTNLVYQDRIIAKAHPSGNRASHCSGITFEVFFKAMQKRNQAMGKPIDDFGLTWDELKDFQLIWYVAKGSKPNSNVAVAVERYGLGKRITNLEEARPGDFIDISRENHTGHTAVFINWIRKNDRIVGVRYWSSQQSTRGINYREEYFNLLDERSVKYGNVMFDHIYIARVY